MTLICCLFKAQSCLLNNFQMFTLGCLKVLLISSHNSSPWSGSLVITKRNTDTLISCPHVKYCFSRALYLPAVATSWQSLAWCLISTPWCSPWDVAGARCQGLVTFWDGAANSYVFSLTPGFILPKCLWDGCGYHEWNRASRAGLSMGTASWPKQRLKWSFPECLPAAGVAF